MAAITDVRIGFSDDGSAEVTITLKRGEWGCGAEASDLPADMLEALKGWIAESES